MISTDVEIYSVHWGDTERTKRYKNFILARDFKHAAEIATERFVTESTYQEETVYYMVYSLHYVGMAESFYLKDTEDP